MIALKTCLSSALFFAFTLSNMLISQTTVLSPFTLAKEQNKRNDLGISGEMKFLDLSQEFNNNVLSKKTNDIQMTFPLTAKKNLNLQLTEFNIFSADFFITDSKGDRFEPEHVGKFYKGTAEGYPKSTVVLNIFDNEISGTIDLGDHVYSLTKIKRSNEYILYEEKDIEQQPELACFAENLENNVKQQVDQSSGSRAPNASNCVKMYFELDHDLFNDFGSISATYNYFAGAFSQVVIMYANENINMTLSEVKVWDTADPYTGPSTGDFLNQFMAALGSSYNGDLAHLVGNSGGGGIAYVNVLCNNGSGFGYSGISTAYSDVPAYSWTVNVLTHEIGHNLGSSHTHACSWNGNNTQIDDCGNQVIDNPGSCYDAANPIIPATGGTIMSYCHMRSVGMNFSLGFGTQPGDLIRNKVYNASCLGPCEECVEDGNACDDGDPCTFADTYDFFCDCAGVPSIPNPCESCTETTISIVVDQFPVETSWEIRDEDNIVVASGSDYGSSSTPQVTNLCINDGCYDFILYDSYGDGICCTYGSGSYSVEDAAGNVLASGGQFSSSETTNFCYSNFTKCADTDADEICDDADPCYDPMVLDMGEMLNSGSYHARGEIILNLGTVIPENVVIKLNAPVITIMKNTVIPSNSTVEISETPCIK